MSLSVPDNNVENHRFLWGLISWLFRTSMLTRLFFVFGQDLCKLIPYWSIVCSKNEKRESTVWAGISSCDVWRWIYLHRKICYYGISRGGKFKDWLTGNLNGTRKRKMYWHTTAKPNVYWLACHVYNVKIVVLVRLVNFNAQTALAWSFDQLRN